MTKKNSPFSKAAFGLPEWHDTRLDGAVSSEDDAAADEFMKALKKNGNPPPSAIATDAEEFFECAQATPQPDATADSAKSGSKASISLESDLLTLESGLNTLDSGVFALSPSGSFSFPAGDGSVLELSSDLYDLVGSAQPEGELTAALNRFAAADSVAIAPQPPPAASPNEEVNRGERMTPMIARPAANRRESAKGSSVPRSGSHALVASANAETATDKEVTEAVEPSCRYASKSGASPERVQTRRVTVKVRTG